MIDTLYYAAGKSAGAGRCLHVNPDCRYLTKAPNVRACDAARPPRGQLCSGCADSDLTVDDIQQAATGDHDDSREVVA